MLFRCVYAKGGGGEVTLVDPFKEHMDKIRERGLILNSSSKEPEIVKMRTAYDADNIGIMDYVIIMVKGYLTKEALEGSKKSNR